MLKNLLCFFIVLFFLCSENVFSQEIDVSKLTASEKKNELIETLDWIKSKSGKNIFAYNKIYSELNYSDIDPCNISLVLKKHETNEIIKTYTFNLKDIYEMSIAYGAGCGVIILKTYENQRLIKLNKDGEAFITYETVIYYDNSVSDERMNKALKYLLKLSGGGKKLLKEKF